MIYFTCFSNWAKKKIKIKEALNDSAKAVVARMTQRQSQASRYTHSRCSLRKHE